MNFITANGHVAGVDLLSDESLLVRDYDRDIAITIDEHLLMDEGGELEMVFDADVWGSTISFAPDIQVTRGGTLELLFAPDVNPAAQVGRSIDLFDWTGVTPIGAFNVTSRYDWDLSQLYTTGEVTLTAVPEPSTLVALVLTAAGVCSCRRRAA